MSTRFAVFLRGINVGGARKIAMADLRNALEAAGLESPRTLLNSGNVLVDHKGPSASVRRAVEEVISDTFGIQVAAIVVSGTKLAAILQASPLGEGRTHHIAFLSETLDAPTVAALKGLAVDGEDVAAKGEVLYLRLDAGVAGSKLAERLPRTIAPVVVTMRTHATVAKLAALL